MSRGTLLAVFLGVLPLACWPGSTSCTSAKLSLIGIGIAAWVVRAAGADSGWSLTRTEKIILAGWLALAGSAVVPAAHTGLALKTHLLLGAGLFLARESRHESLGSTESRWPTAGLVAGACLAGLIALYQSMGGNEHLLSGLARPDGYGTLGNPNRVGALCGIVLFPSISLWLVPGPRGWLRVVGGLGSGLLVLSVFRSGGTAPLAGILAASACILVFFCVQRLRGQRAAFRGFATMATLVVLAGVGFGIWSIQSMPRLPSNRLVAPLERILDNNDWTIRRTDWIAAYEMFRGQPIVGVGLAGYSVDWIETRAALSRSERYAALAEHAPPAASAHNDYLQWAAETGAVGIALALVLVAWLIFGWWRRAGSLAGRLGAEHVWLTGGIVCAGVIALVDFPMHGPAPAAAIWYLVGRTSWRTCPSGSGRRASVMARWSIAAPVAAFTLAWGIGSFVTDIRSARLADDFLQGRVEDIPETQSLLERCLSVGSRDRMYVGLALWARGDQDGAKHELDMAMAEKPSFEALLARAELAIEGRSYRSAEMDLRQVVDCRPIRRFRRQASYLSGLLLLRQGRTDEAKAEFTRAAERYPESYRVRMALGYVASLEKDPFQARREYEIAAAVLADLLAGRVKDMDTTPGLRMVWAKHQGVVERALQSLGN